MILSHIIFQYLGFNKNKTGNDIMVSITVSNSVAPEICVAASWRLYWVPCIL